VLSSPFMTTVCKRLVPSRPSSTPESEVTQSADGYPADRVLSGQFLLL
jgi:hypothetical protein